MLKARTIAVGNERFDIRDDGVPSVFTDLIIESRLMGGIVCLSLGTLVADGDVEAENSPEAVIAARLRMTLRTARAIHEQLSLLIERADQELKAKPN
jgi:hypothetical protein